ncbi:hypothetical protein JCM33374_g2125 [Metschnikowia sp. JCM 33374]|nr:hypothetical protein JCM33374_g2125 [Metschnikowia sp. JCM 33374]
MSDNIQVVVRCRARNRQEIAAKSPAIIELPNNEYSANEPFITIANDPLSTLSGLSRAIPATGKTFKVDQVYGPNADQGLLFDNVALPLFHDFISGLNVTILAYGQTGSGKTYSMFGDLTGENAGIIPRVLSKLFTSIGADFMVKISCVELYKEELHDLINDEFNLTSNKSKLRLGHSKEAQSTVIQNLTEIHIDSCEMGFNILKQCLGKRRTSATKLNDHSSRSHTIFSINLWKRKDSTSDHYCVSKMNLVDLAGSEDINKSGAINERAREAGSINQSLLALGKVISALSEDKETKHIPYRESKLTRILEGSIGGQTKTALIATISPAKVNVFETVSTLNYASKAKNIKNLPQSRDSASVCKNVLIQDLSSEIARLERDRLSAKDKDGNVKISLQNYKEFFNARIEHETRRKEDAARIEMLSAKLQAKSTEISLVQQKHAAAEAQLIESRQSNVLKDELISKMRDEESKRQQIDSHREAKFHSEVKSLESKVSGILMDANAFISTYSSSITDDLEAKQKNMAEFLQSTNHKVQTELRDFQALFGPQWKQELSRQIKHDLDFSLEIEKLQRFDMSPELSQLEVLTENAQARIDTTLSLKAHEELVKGATEKMIQKQDSLKEEILTKFRKTLDETFTANSDGVCSVIKDNVADVLSRSNLQVSDAMQTLSNGQLKLTRGITKKAEEHTQRITNFKTEMEKKRDGAGTKISEETGSKISRGIENLLQLNLEQGNASVTLINNCMDGTKAMMRTSNETFKAKLDNSKGNVPSPLPLTEIKDTNSRSSISPKRKSSTSTLLRSPQRHGLPDPKRRKSSNPTIEDSRLFRSQIPQLQSMKK